MLHKSGDRGYTTTSHRARMCACVCVSDRERENPMENMQGNRVARLTIARRKSGERTR